MFWGTGVSALGLAAVGFGAFAFFSDTAEQDTTGTVGTVDVTNKDILLYISCCR